MRLDQVPTELHDIVAAPAASWWPLAPGWYALVALLTLSLSALVIWLHRYLRSRRVRNHMLKQLRQPQPNCQQVTLLIKQACLGYLPRQSISELSGDDWINFLLTPLSSKQQQQWQALLRTAVRESYVASTDPSTVAEYQKFARYWLHLSLPNKVKQLQGAGHV